MTHELYQARILAHAQHSPHRGALARATHVFRAANQSCGDSLTLYVRVEGTTITEASFTGDGCAISLASASLLCEELVSKDLASVALITPGRVYTLMGVPISPARSRCALLAYSALASNLAELTPVPGAPTPHA